MSPSRAASDRPVRPGRPNRRPLEIGTSTDVPRQPPPGAYGCPLLLSCRPLSQPLPSLPRISSTSPRGIPHRSARVWVSLTDVGLVVSLAASLGMGGPKPAKPRLPPRWFNRLAWIIHRRLYRWTGGRLGLWRPKPGGCGAMRLTTIGRRTGRARAVIVGYFEDGPNLVTMAMNGWGDLRPTSRMSGSSRTTSRRPAERRLRRRSHVQLRDQLCRR